MYPYPTLLPLLQFRCTPTEYQSVSKKKHHNEEYWKIIPLYTYAYCPICDTQYREPADTYSLGGWWTPSLRKTLYAEENEGLSISKRCKHFLGIHEFINLHGLEPTEIQYFQNSEGEVPYITSQFFHKDIEAYAVLHALPICRVTSDTFVPSYTIFTLSYFSQEPKTVIERRYDEQQIHAKIDPEYYPATIQPAGFGDANLYDLSGWAKQGKLGWLNPSDPDLSLELDKDKQLPEIYSSIKGNRHPYVWTNGRIIS